MRLNCTTLSAACLLLPLTVSAAVRPHHHTAVHPLVRHNLSAHTARHPAVERVATPSMSSERATEIQLALIQRGYLTGEASGTWDAASFAAMQKMQSDNGWQTKLVPDSRALIKLGLGPNSAPEATSTAGIPAVPETQSFN